MEMPFLLSSVPYFILFHHSLNDYPTPSMNATMTNQSYRILTSILIVIFSYRPDKKLPVTSVIFEAIRILSITLKLCGAGLFSQAWIKSALTSNFLTAW